MVSITRKYSIIKPITEAVHPVFLMSPNQQVDFHVKKSVIKAVY